jgi:hypothetical protein
MTDGTSQLRLLGEARQPMLVSDGGGLGCRAAIISAIFRV